jgi:hypothetical protein
MNSLRHELEDMTHVEDVTRYPALLQSVNAAHPNTVKLLDSPHPIHRYTCLVYAFNFAEQPEYVAIATQGLAVVFAGRQFAHWMIDHGHLSEVTAEDASTGDMVFYFDGQGQFQHAGIVNGGNRILSKWGTGHLYEHELLDVPESYGTQVRFFRSLPFEDAIQRFVEFAREKGMFI